MPKTTISFTIEEEQLEQVDALAERVRLNRSVTLGLLIDQGMQAFVDDSARGYAQQFATAMLRGPLPVPADVCADADVVA